MLARLADGTEVLVRPIAPDDKPRLATGLSLLSEESVRRRFLSPKPRFSAAELRYLTEVDGHDHAALVAVLPEQPDQLIAVARYVRLREDPATAEFAIVVGDPHQRRGLGKLLGTLLAEEARAHGVRRFTATVLADNLPAQRLISAISHRLPYVSRAGAVSELTGELAA